MQKMIFTTLLCLAFCGIACNGPSQSELYDLLKQRGMSDYDLVVKDRFVLSRGSGGHMAMLVTPKNADASPDVLNQMFPRNIIYTERFDGSSSSHNIVKMDIDRWAPQDVRPSNYYKWSANNGGVIYAAILTTNTIVIIFQDP